jgi:hypothetical protein
VKFGINLDKKWEYSSELESKCKGLPNINSKGITDFSTMKKGNKVETKNVNVVAVKNTKIAA